MPRRFWVETLGCPKNQVDSDKLTGTLVADGLVPADAPGDADLVVVNTCAFIEEARQESIDTILGMADTRQGRRAARGHGLPRRARRGRARDGFARSRRRRRLRRRGARHARPQARRRPRWTCCTFRVRRRPHPGRTSRSPRVVIELAASARSRASAASSVLARSTTSSPRSTHSRLVRSCSSRRIWRELRPRSRSR